MGLTISRVAGRTQETGSRIRKKEKEYSRGRTGPSTLGTIRKISSMVKEHSVAPMVASTLGPGQMAKSTDLESFTKEGK